MQGNLLNRLGYGVPSAPTIFPHLSNKFNFTYDHKEQQSSIKKNGTKRPKAHSIHHLKRTDINHKPSKFVPLNKDYQLCEESIFFYI